MSAVGKVTDQWQIIASYTNVHARITKSSVISQIDAVPMNTPEHSLAIWTTYDITPQWQVGGGAFYASNAWADLGTPAAPLTITSPFTPNSALIPAYWRFDAMAAYKITPKSTLQFNIYNLTNEYYAASAYTNWYVPGPSRYASLTYRYSW